MKLTAIEENIQHFIRTLSGQQPDASAECGCSCNDLDHLYLYEPMETNNEITWETLKKGDYLDNYGYKHKILERVGDLIFISKAKSSDNGETTFSFIAHTEELPRINYSIVQPPKKLTREQVLASLTPEQRAALGE